MALRNDLPEMLGTQREFFEGQAQYYLSKFTPDHPLRRAAERMAKHAQQEAERVEKAIKSKNETKMRKALNNLSASKRIERMTKRTD